jgi:hypothetical protein
MKTFFLLISVSTQNNALRILNKLKNGNSFLHPGVSIDIQLQQRNPLNILVEQNRLTDEQYWQDPPVAIGAGPVYDIRINKVTLLYESLILEDLDEVARINRSVLQYPVDCPTFRLLDLAGGAMHDSLNFALPRGTRIVYLMFVHESQIVQNVVRHSYMSTRYRFPPFLDYMTFNLVGKNGIVMSKGLHGISKGRNSHSLRSFHSEMVKKGLYTKDFDAWFPPTRNGLGYDIILPIDLEFYHRQFREIATLNVELGYTQASRTNWSLRCWAVSQRLYQYSSKDMWTFKDTV